ncbi:MAG TPA: TetR/AcrR family transcriptional regulator [Propioniciclava sp.]|jgi:AcrR family transcriptional regulator|uniref:TetR/AcrR family transcriptional regulator n=1 Tax=Propioniciclava sp. TaxID=2038686 RepID=UPI002B844D02|nr:TetR/AcrR family transcriptional regulator [Propioniciclava sp.]HRL49615.1 TetR/AcrR family transcriptional regulator [Propioniciclava sp.]
MAQSRRQQQADARREQLLDVALDLFATQGFDATSTQQIAKAAGVAQGLVFHYFGSKEGLLSAVLSTRHSFASGMADMLTEAETSPMPLGDVLRALCTGWLDTLHRERSVTLLLAGLALTNPTFGTQLNEAIAATQKMLANVLERRRDAGEVSEDADLGIAAHDILTPVIMYFLLHHASPHWKTEAAQFIDNHCTLWQRALAP